MAKQNKGKQAGKKKQANQSMQTSKTNTNLTPKGMIKDVDALYLGDKNWSHAINAINNSVDGDTGVIGNEPANLHCADVPYRIIGGVHQYGDKWILFSTDNYSSEIGLFDDSQCEYTTLINDACLNFNQDNLIIGASKENFDCSWQVYWDDGLNPSRTLNLDNIPWVQMQTSAINAPCVTFEDTSILDCEKLRLAPWVDVPCIKLSKAPEGGQLMNGSYQVYLAYLVNDKQIGDYVGVSNIQPLWSHENSSGSININLSNLDTEFEYYKIVVAFAHSTSVVAKKLGVYTTQQTTINIDYINPSLPDVDKATLPRRGEAYEKSMGMYVVNDYLIRSHPVEQFDFNYQPIANNIKAKWVSTKYPSDYYREGGNKPTFLRDEQYSFFIRFIYNTGERSSSYHIPGRPPVGNENLVLEGDINAFDGETEKYFEAYNTATSETAGSGLAGTVTDDGGVIIGVGEMGYWESTEVYPALDPVRWNTNENVQNGTVSLCGKPIRHHKMPDESLASGECALSSVSGQYIHILGVYFENISPPLDNEGEVIANIQGFEILTGSRVGNKSIIAKGIIRNMMEYDSVDGNGEEGVGDAKNYMANYPYNSLLEDPYLNRPGTGNSLNYLAPLENIAPSDNWLIGQWEGFSSIGDIKSFHHNAANDNRSLSTFSENMFTFHSPETQFERVYLNARELRVYDNLSGISTGHFTKSEGHPQHKILKDWMAVVAIIAGVGYAIYQMRGKKKRAVEGMQSSVTGEYGIMAVGTGSWAAPFPLAGNVAAGINTAGSWGALAADALGDYALEALVNAGSVGGIGQLAKTVRLTAFKTQELGAAALSAGHIGPKATVTYEGTKFSETPDLLGILTGLTTFMAHTATGGQELVDLLLNLMSYQDYTWKYNSHGFFKTSHTLQSDRPHRFNINKNMYIGSNLQNMDSSIKINNMHRPGMVVLNTSTDVNHRQSVVDNSKFIIGDLRSDIADVCSWQTPGVPTRSSISALYVGLKFNIDNQYGQLDSIKQMPLRGCSFMFKDQMYCDPNKPEGCPPVVATDLFSTILPLFGGDNYINRYTEKTVMPFWWNFMKGEPDGTPFDYRRYTNIPFPRYWMNTEKFRLDEMTKVFQNFFSFNNNMSSLLPSGMYHLDQAVSGIPVTNGLTGTEGGTSVGEQGGQGSGGALINTEGQDVICSCTGNGTVTVSDTGTTNTIWAYSGACTMSIEIELDDGSTGMATAYVTASGEHDFENSDELGGHGVDDFISPGWPNGGVDLQEVSPIPSVSYTGPGTITITGTYSHQTNLVSVVSNNVSFGSSIVQAQTSITTAPDGVPVATIYNWSVPVNFFNTSDLAVANSFVCDDTNASAPTPASEPDTSFEPGEPESGSKFAVRDAYMYTHNNGVLDFFVESELNLAFRDRGEENDKRHYDKFEFTDVNALFHADIIQAGNYYKYNKQLSNKYFQTQISASWGEIQPRYYDPYIAASCWVDYPKRLIYSLQASEEERKDNWRVFLPDNRKDFKDRVTTIKGLAQVEALMLFPTLSPRLFSGIDTIQTTKTMTKFSIGDGGLFSKEPQNIANSDLSHEYGSCESNRSVTTSPHGVFFVSQAQGKIFQYAGKGLDPISNQGMKWWFNKYLPSNLLAQFPDIADCPIGDNPLTGIGCQSIFDPNNDLVYFSKKDYSVLPSMSDCVQYNACDGFVYNLSVCEGTATTITCPDGYFYNDELGTCQATQTVEALITPVACEADIVIVVDSSNSIVGNNNKGNMMLFLDNLITGLFANATPSGNSTDLRVGILHFGAGRNTTSDLAGYTSTGQSDTMFNPGEQIALTSTQNDLTCWITGCSTTVYNTAASAVDNPEGTDLVGGIWSGMNLLYGANSRPDVPKRLIIIGDGSHGTLGTGGGYYDAADVHLTAGTVNPATPDVTIGNQDDSNGFTYETTSDSITWMQTEIINNTSVYGTQQTYFIGFDTAQTGGASTPTPNQQQYFDNFANDGNTHYGSLSDDATTISGIISSIIEDVCPPPVYVCPDDPNLTDCTLSGQRCICTVSVPPIEIDQTLPIELTDTLYFEDVSWTVSYDPKSKAWVSFHDWHPELSFNSINHFMTTKALVRDIGSCPPGYELNDEKLCCLTVVMEEPAQLVDDEMAAFVDITSSVRTNVYEADIAIVMDNTNGIAASGYVEVAQQTFVKALIGNDGTNGQPITNLAIGILDNNPTLNVGIASYAGDYTLDNQNFQVDAALPSTVPDLITAVGTVTGSANVGDFDSAINASNHVLSPSQADRQIAIIITSGKANRCGLANNGTNAVDELFDAGTEVYVVHIQDHNSPLSGCGFGSWQNNTGCLITQANSPETAVCNENHFEITTTMNYQATIDLIIENMSFTGCVCPVDTEPVPDTYPCLPVPYPEPECMECLCPTDYVLQEGPCDQLNPPLCVQEGCSCGEAPVPGATLVETGICNNIHTPLMCTWTYENCIPPTFDQGTVWKHNVRTDLFSNYYGEDFPWEVDILQSSGQLVNTVRSIEYNLESYVYKNEGRDRFHLLDFNFDQAELYNTEQTSGLLNLVLSPKNDIPAVMLYPIINADDIDILYSKEEQKYRFNQFWDVTEDRGEFTEIQEPIYITQLNGYIRDLNMENIDLTKEAFQRKKFRHYYNHIILRRAVSGDAKMLLRLTNTKINLSPR